MRLPARKTWIVAAFVTVALTLATAAMIYWRVAGAVGKAEQSVAAERNLRFTVAPFVAPAGLGWDPISAPAAFTHAAEFNGNVYVAGPAGLFEYDAGGNPKREWRVGRELPASPLLRIARGTLADAPEPELLVASADAGVLAFNGNSFRQILPAGREARSITAILPSASGHLLIGTERAGLLVYDGKRLQPFHAALAAVRVTDLAGSESDLWIGTQDRGVAHFHGGSAEWFDDSNGLPDARVYSIAIAGERTFVGTSAGVAEFAGGRFARVLAPGAFVRALLPLGKVLMAGTMDDGVLELPLAQASRATRQSGAGGELADVEQFFVSGDTLYAVTSQGVFARAAAAEWKRVLQPVGGVLSDRNISALAVDAAGRLWIGFFDRGLDILDNGGQRTRHVEDDNIFCVNRIVANAHRGEIAVATANGLVLFDSGGVRRQVLGRNEGLIADHVTDVAAYGDGMAVATPAGLTFLDAGGARSLYAFHGLVNNHVYAIGANGRHLLAGTLGGASLLEDDQVRASFTTATSALKHNWITAVVPMGNEWWLGTYGAGVVHMDAAGRFEAANGASGELVINPNAMLATDRLLLAGSMGQGLFVMNRDSGRWLAVRDGLPSLNVTALAAGNGYVYVGTDNGLVRIAEQSLVR